MKYAVVLTMLLAVGLSQGSSLLEMSQVLWNRILGGGYQRVGRLDPLRVPVVKVDQSEGDTSYRVVLRNLEVRGLNASTIESVHIARGSLKSNLSDSEAGYVSYNEQKGLDSIRYRFHTLVKEPKPSGELEESASEQFDRVVEYDPVTQKATTEEYPQRYGDNFQRRNYNGTFKPVATSYSNMRVAVNPAQPNPSQVRVVYSNNYKFNPSQEEFVRPCIGACRRNQVPVKGAKNPSYGAQQQYPGVNFGSPVYQEQRFAETTQSPQPGVKVQYGGASFSAGSPNGQSQFSVKGGNDQPSYSGNFGNGQFAVKGQDSGKPGFNVNYNGNNGQFSAASQEPGNQERPQFFVKGGNDQSPSYSGSFGNGQFAVKGQDSGKPGFNVNYNGNNGQFSAASQEPAGNKGFGVNYSGNSGAQFAVKGQDSGKPGFNVNYNGNNGQFSAASQEPAGNKGFGVNYSGNSGAQFAAQGQDSGKPGFNVNYNNGQFAAASTPDQFSAKGGAYNTDRFGDAEDSASDNHETKVQFDGSGLKYSGNLGNAQVKGGDKAGFSFNYGDNAGTTRPLYNYQERPAPINGDTYFGNQGEPSNARYQTGQYAEATTSAFVEEFQPFKSPLIRLEKQPGYVDIVYTTSKRKGTGPRFDKPADDPRYYAFDEAAQDLPANHSYNYTDGEPLLRQYKADIDSQRIRDLARYAKEYQEKQGYFEEGMELIYHFGNVNSTDAKTSTNDTLNRKKRQHSDKDEEDVMHVIVRIRVPKITVKSGYALTGKVGKQPVRGNGLLDGTFTDVTADFTVELKQVDNRTMIVRAARAKLVCRDHKIKLHGMDDKGPAESILSHGLMAAEAVAAMIADDLATKIVNEGHGDATIYKMYKNLPKST